VNPAGLVELNDEDMSSVSGGCTTCGDPFHTPIRSCKNLIGVEEISI
ncbi:mersacidin/lichenicidin family type 2 lantibiotic, partial [Anabaena sp. UHCC 0451]